MSGECLPIGILAATRAELSAATGAAAAGFSVPEAGARRWRFDGVETVAVVTGQGAARAAAALEQTLDRRPLRAVLVAGLAGGTQPGQAPGRVLVASGAGPPFAAPAPACPRLAAAVMQALNERGPPPQAGALAHVDQLADADDKRRLGRAGFVGVDMETHAVLAGARSAGVPAVGLRVVLDPPGRGIPRAVAALGALQGGRLWPEILGLGRLPLELRAAIRFVRDLRTALRALRAAAPLAVRAIDQAAEERAVSRSPSVRVP